MFALSHEASTHSLPRALSKWGVLSRAAAERAIAEGRVALDGRVCRDPKRRVTEGVEQVALDGQVVVAGGAQRQLPLPQPPPPPPQPQQQRQRQRLLRCRRHFLY